MARDRTQMDAVFILREAWLRRSGGELGRVAVGRRLPLVVVLTVPESVVSRAAQVIR